MADPIKPVSMQDMLWGMPQANPVPTPAPTPAISAPSYLDNQNTLSGLPPSVSDTKRANLDSIAESKKQKLGGLDYQRMAMAEREGNQIQQSEFESDVQSLPYDQLVRKWGNDGIQARGEYLTTQGLVDRTMDAERTWGDAARSAVSGGVTGVVGAAALGAAAFDDSAGVNIAGAMEPVSDWFNSFSSEGVQQKRKLEDVQDQLDAEENAELYKQDIANGETNLWAGAKRIGRDFLKVAGNVVSNPDRASEVIAEGVGSLAVSAGSGSIVTSLLSRGASKEVAESLAPSITALMISSQESGDAYASAVSEVVGMSQEELAQSPVYQQLRADGMSHDNALVELADRAGKISAGIVAPASFLAGRAVSSFETSPLGIARNRGLTDAAKTVATQGSEEAFQEGITAFGSNVGIRESGADTNRDLTQGVGQGAALGAVGGVGMAAGARAVPASLAGASDAIDATRAGIARVADNRKQKTEAKENQQVQEASTNIRTEMDQLVADIESGNIDPEQMLQEVQQSATEVEAPKTDPREYLQKLNTVVSVSNDDLNQLPDYAQELYFDGPAEEDIVPKAVGLKRMADSLSDESIPSNERAQVKLYLRKQLAMFEEVSAAGDNIHPAVADRFKDIGKSLSMIRNQPTLSKVADTPLTMGEVNAVTKIPESMDAPDALQDIQNIIDAATYGAGHVSSDKIDYVLNNDGNGYTLKNEQKQALQVARTLYKELKKTSDKFLKLQQKDPKSYATVRKVSGDILNKSEDGAPSILDHVTGISQAAQTNNKAAREAATDGLYLFLLGQSNKVKALEQAKKNGDGKRVGYAVNTSKGWWGPTESKKSVYFNKGTAVSEMMLDTAKTELAAIEATYAGIIEAFPDYRPHETMEVDGESELAYRDLTRQSVPSDEIEVDMTNVPAEEPVEKKERSTKGRKGVTYPAANDLVEDTTPDRIFDAAVKALIQTKGTTDLAGSITVNRSEFTREQLKHLRDVYKVDTTKAVMIIPSELGAKPKQAPQPKLEGAQRNLKNAFNRFLSKKKNHNVKQDSLFAITPEQRTDLDVLATEIFEPLGFNFSKVLKNILGFDMVDPSKPGLRGYGNTNGLVFNSQFLDTLKNQTDSHVHLLAHELGHIIDFYGERNLTEGRLFDAGSAFQKDILKAMDTHPEVKAYFDKYAMTFTDQKTKNQEIFAEFSGLFFMNPEETFNLMPVASKAFYEAVNGTFGKRGQTLEGILGLDKPSTQEVSSETQVTEEEQVTQDIQIEQTHEEAIPRTSLTETFWRAYKPREGFSLLNVKSPVKFLADKIQPKNPQEEKAWSNVLGHLVPQIQKTMNERLKADMSADRRGEKIQDLVVSGKLNLANNMLDTSLTQINAKGELEYIPTVLEAVSLAAMQWYLKETGPLARDVNAEKAAKLYGVDEAEVTRDMLAAMRIGSAQQSSLETLHGLIDSYLGVSPDRKTTTSLAGGVTMAMAAEALNSMESIGIIKIQDTPLKIPTRELNAQGDPVMMDYTLRSIVDTKGQFDESKVVLKKATDVIDRILNPEAEPEYFIGEAPTKGMIRRTQMRNRMNDLSPAEIKAISNEMQKPYYLNVPLLNAMNVIGKDAWLKMLGYTKIDPKKINRKHKESIEGVNLSLDQGWDKLMDHADRIIQYADENGMEPNKVPNYYLYEISKVGRLQQKGFGGQADKRAREAIATTISTLDLNNKAQDDLFWMTIAQSMGLKTEKLYRAKAVQKAKDMFASGSDLEKASLLLESASRGEELSSANVAFIQNVVGEASDKKLHAILAVGRYNAAFIEGGDALTQFEHALSLESDGKTDGPINAIMNFLSGGFTQDQINLMARGGMFLNRKDKTLNQFFTEDEGQDLYEMVAGIFQNQMSDFTQKISDNKELSLMMNTVLNFASLSGNIEVKDGVLSNVSRNLVKNPLTVSTYGAGTKGIAGKVTNEILDVMYSKFSEALQTGNQTEARQILTQLKALTSFSVRKDAETGDYSLTKLKGHEINVNVSLDTFELTPVQYKRLEKNIQMMFSDHLVNSIRTMMGDTIRTMELMQNTTQVQSTIAIDEFNKRVEELKAQRVAEGKLLKSQELSDEDYTKVMHDIAPFGAQVIMLDQELNMGVSESTRPTALEEGGPKKYAVRSRGKINGYLKRPTPSKAGVKAAPFMVIATGDGAMILRLASQGDGLPKTLMVFDGIEMAADMIDSQSAQINKVVAENWSKDTSAAVADSFESFLRNYDFRNASTEALLELTRIFSPADYKARKPLNAAQLEPLVVSLGKQMRDASDEIRARKLAMQDIGYSVDHMASGEQPYTHNVDTFDSDAEAVAFLNERYKFHLDALRAERGEKLLPEVDTGVADKIRQNLGVDGDRVINVEVNTIKNAIYDSLVNKDQKSVFLAAAKVLKNSSFLFHFGSREKLTELRNTQNAALTNERMINQGQIDISTQNVYIASGSVETILHETIHAATLQQMIKAVREPESTSKEVQEAVRRTRVLMDQFLNTNFNEIVDIPALEAGLNAQAEIQRHLGKGTQDGEIAAMNELMAWALSNQQLIDWGRKTRAYSPLARVAMSVIRQVKIFLGINSDVRESFYNNLRYNFEVLSAEFNEGDGGNDFTLLDHALSVNQKESLRKLGLRVAKFRGSSRAASRNFSQALQKAVQATNAFISAGFTFTAEERHVFQTVQTALATTMDLDKPSLLRAQELYKHAMKHLDHTVFLNDPKTATQSDIALAKSKFAALQSVGTGLQDAQGRTLILSSFLALSQADEQFRTALNSIHVPEGDRLSGNLRDRVEDTYNQVSTKFSDLLFGNHNPNSTVQEALDQVIAVLADTEKDTIVQIESEFNKAYSAIENKGNTYIQQTIDMALDKLRNFRNTQTNKIIQMGLTGVDIALSSLSLKNAQSAGDVLTSLSNNIMVPTTLRDLWSEARGITSDNRSILDMVNEVKYAVSAARQDFTENLPETLSRAFNHKPTDQQWSSMSRVLIDTDIAAVVSKYSFDDVKEFLTDDRKLQAEISALKSLVHSSEGYRARMILNKADALAEYMSTGKVTTTNLLRNADAIARGLGTRFREMNVNKSTVDNVDVLVSLLAIEKLTQGDRDIVQDLLLTEDAAMRMMMNYMKSMHDREMSKNFNLRAKFNHIKGKVDSRKKDSGQIIIAPLSERKEKEKLSYQYIGDYPYGKHDVEQMAYYYSPVSGKSSYNQGVLQTVQQSIFGVDAETGSTIGSGGKLNRLEYGMALNNYMDIDGLQDEERLQPIYDATGNITAFERTFSVDMRNRIQKDEHLGRRLGAWRGRQAEEILSGKYNEMLITNLKDMWERDKWTKASEYINLADPLQRDRVHDYIWAVIPKQTKDMIQSEFGGNKTFMVRRDLLNNALGYPAASIGDVFTGTTRWNPAVAKATQQALTTIFGARAYEFAIKGEKLWQSVVSAAKVTIVVKSVIVPLSNIVSNVFQALMRGVPLRAFGKPLAAKVAETNMVIRNQKRLSEIEVEMAGADGNQVVINRLNNERQSLEDAIKRTSIWPLIQKGEFTTISEGLTEEDKNFENNGFMDKVEALVDKLPDGVKTVGKYALVTKDTPLFKFLNRSVQYGDFIAKSLVYDHYIEEGLNPEEAMLRITNEFVNYNLLSGRVRSSLESLGLMWFWNFKIRSVRVALSMMRDNPLRALMWSMSPIRELPIPGISDSIMTDNAISKTLSGSFGSLGPSMVTHIWESNPYVRFAN